MFNKKDVMKKLGIVSASALMLLGVGAGMTSVHTNVHADSGLILTLPSKKENQKDDAVVKRGEEMDRKAFIQSKSGSMSPADASKAFDLSQEINNFEKTHRGFNTTKIDNAMDGTNLHKMEAVFNQTKAKVGKINTHKHTYAIKRTHKDDANAIKRGKRVRHHKIHRSLKHDVVYVNRINHKRYARKHISKQVHNVKRHARRTNKHSKRANLQREIKSLKRQLRKARTWRSKRNIKRQLNRLTKQHNSSYGKRTKRGRKMNKRVRRHGRKHADGGLILTLPTSKKEIQEENADDKRGEEMDRKAFIQGESGRMSPADASKAFDLSQEINNFEKTHEDFDTNKIDNAINNAMNGTNLHKMEAAFNQAKAEIGKAGTHKHSSNHHSNHHAKHNKRNHIRKQYHYRK